MGLSELQQVNAVIGLSKDITGWPSTLADHKYTLDRIELKLTVPNPVRPGSNKVINPDLLFVSDERNYSILVELKGGKYTDRVLEQCQNMAELTPIQLVRNGRVTNLPVFSLKVAALRVISLRGLSLLRQSILQTVSIKSRQ